MGMVDKPDVSVDVGCGYELAPDQSGFNKLIKPYGFV